MSAPLRVAVDATYPPMEFEGDDGKVTGFDVDFSKELAKELGRPVEFVVMNWDGILAGLQSGRYDVIISSMNITPERSKQVNFVPYLSLAQVFVSRTGVGAVRSELELAGKVVAVQADTTSHELVQKIGSRVKIKEIRAFKGATDCFSALKSKQADVIVIDEPVGLYYSKLSPKVFEVTGKASRSEPIGIAIRKKDQELFQAIGLAVEKIKKSPRWAEMSQRWFGRVL
jgi:ABC-type amino acid transport substrate-binding protein